MDHALPPTRSRDFDKKGEPKRVFLSYAREDAQLASTLARAIQKCAGESLVLSFDAWSAKPGSDLATSIASMIQESDAMIVLLPNNGTHTWIGAELALGLARSESDGGFQLIAVRTIGAVVPILLQSRVYIDLAHSDVLAAARQITDAVLSTRTSDLASSEGRDLLLSAQIKALELDKIQYERASRDSRWLLTASLLLAAISLLLAITASIAPNNTLVERVWALVVPLVMAFSGYIFGRRRFWVSKDATGFDRERIRND